MFDLLGKCRKLVESPFLEGFRGTNRTKTAVMWVPTKEKHPHSVSRLFLGFGAPKMATASFLVSLYNRRQRGTPPQKAAQFFWLVSLKNPPSKGTLKEDTPIWVSAQITPSPPGFISSSPMRVSLGIPYFRFGNCCHLQPPNMCFAWVLDSFYLVAGWLVGWFGLVWLVGLYFDRSTPFVALFLLSVPHLVCFDSKIEGKTPNWSLHEKRIQYQYVFPAGSTPYSTNEMFAVRNTGKSSCCLACRVM